MEQPEKELQVRNLTTEDFFKFMRVVDKTDARPVVKKGMTQEQVGVDFFYNLFVRSYKAEREWCEFIGGVIGKDADEVRTMDLADLLHVFQQLAKQDRFVGFIRQLLS